MCEEGGHPKNECKLSSGWFFRFIVCSGLHNIKFSGESTSAGHATIEKFLTKLVNIISEGGYKPDHLFNANDPGV